MRFLDTRSCLLIALVISCHASAGEPAKPSNWERFRGPNGAGTSDDKNIPLKFGPKENLLWKVELPGVGNSSPIIWGQHLFLHATSKDGKTRSLLCLDTAYGKIRWEKSIPAGPAKIRADSSLASSTPTTDGKAVYVSFWDGKEVLVSAYDFQGQPIWSKNLGVFNSQHGAGASPILYQDKLILAHDMDKDDFTTKVPNARPSMLMAFDKKTGDERELPAGPQQLDAALVEVDEEVRDACVAIVNSLERGLEVLDLFLPHIGRIADDEIEAFLLEENLGEMDAPVDDAFAVRFPEKFLDFRFHCLDFVAILLTHFAVSFEVLIL